MGEGGAMEGHTLLGKGQPSATRDLFPHLDTLVPSNLTTWGVISAGGKLIPQHLKAFLLPIFFATLLSPLSFVYQLRQQSQATDGIVAETPWYVLAMVLLYGLAEAGFHRAVVGIYLKQRYGEPEPSSSKAFILAALRSTGSVVVNTIILAFVLILALFSYFAGSWFLFYCRPISRCPEFLIPMLTSTVTLVTFFLCAFSIAALPASVLTTVWGLNALKESFLLTKGNRWSSLGLYLTFSLLALVSFIIPTLWREEAEVRTTTTVLIFCTLLLWLINLIWFPIRTVLYFKLRACHRIRLLNSSMS